jgi:hypothetical protein
MNHPTRMSGVVAVIAALCLGGCIVNPQYDGETVRCASDTDCAHLPGAFECHADAGLCVRVDGQGGDCDPACGADEVCIAGVCVEEGVPPCGGECATGYVCDEELDECVGDPGNCDPACHPLDVCTEDQETWLCRTGRLRFTVDTPEALAWVRDTTALSGTVRHGTDDGEPVVRCGLDGDTPAVATVGAGEAHPEDVGVVVAPWTCEVDLSQAPEGELEIVVSAEGEVRSGTTTRAIRRDVTEPSITEIGIAPEHGTPTVTVPQEIAIVAVAEDAMGAVDGSVARIHLQVLAPSGHVVYTHTCDGEAGVTLTCSGSFDLRADADAEDAWRTEEGTYTVRASAEDEAGNPTGDEGATTSVAEKTFEVIRTPDVGVYVAKAPQIPEDVTTVRIRRYEGATIQVRTSRPEQIVGSPLLEIRQAQQNDQGACVSPIDLTDRLDAEEADGGTWQLALSAMEPCLGSAQKTYMVVAVVEDVWTYDPESPRVLEGVECDGPNEACAGVQITRELWDPVDLCGERESCSVLTPAVGGAGAIYAGINFTSSIDGHAHHVKRVALSSGASTDWWTGSVWTRFHLRDGPVVQEHADGRRVYVTGSGGLVALREGSASDRIAWQYPDIGGDATIDVLGPPAIGHEGAVYVPIKQQSLLGDGGDDLSPPEGGLAVLNPDDGGGYDDAVYLLGDPMDGHTQIVVRPGSAVEWVALFDPRGFGGRFQCDWPLLSCYGRALPSPGARLGHLAAHTSGYLLGHLENLDDGDTLSRFDWHRSSGSDQASWSLTGTSILAGPVYDHSRLFLAGEDGLTITSVPGSTSIQTTTVPLAGEIPKGLSLGQGGPYILYASGVLEARDLTGGLLWSHEIASPGEGARPTITSTTVPDLGAIGVLLVPGAGRLHAFITDDAGPATGWPNDRGRANRQGASLSAQAQ